MKATTAKKILTRHGIRWSNYTELCYIETAIKNSIHKDVLEALKTLKEYILHG